jgi:PAS domain S-box-containing protein
VLRERESKWRSIAEHSPDYISLLDRDATIEFVNRTVPELTVEQVIATPIYDYVPEKFRSAMKACFEPVLETGEPDRYETEFHCADGPVKRAGEIVGLVVSSRGVTGRNVKCDA